MSEKYTPEISCYTRFCLIAAGTIGATALFSCTADTKDEQPLPSDVPTITVITTESPTLYPTPEPTPTPLPPIPVAPPPSYGR